MGMFGKSVTLAPKERITVVGVTFYQEKLGKVAKVGKPLSAMSAAPS